MNQKHPLNETSGKAKTVFYREYLVFVGQSVETGRSVSQKAGKGEKGKGKPSFSPPPQTASEEKKDLMATSVKYQASPDFLDDSRAAPSSSSPPPQETKGSSRVRGGQASRLRGAVGEKGGAEESLRGYRMDLEGEERSQRQSVKSKGAPLPFADVELLRESEDVVENVEQPKTRISRVATREFARGDSVMVPISIGFPLEGVTLQARGNENEQLALALSSQKSGNLSSDYRSKAATQGSLFFSDTSEDVRLWGEAEGALSTIHEEGRRAPCTPEGLAELETTVYARAVIENQREARGGEVGFEVEMENVEESAPTMATITMRIPFTEKLGDDALALRILLSRALSRASGVGVDAVRCTKVEAEERWVTVVFQVVERSRTALEFAVDKIKIALQSTRSRFRRDIVVALRGN